MRRHHQATGKKKTVKVRGKIRNEKLSILQLQEESLQWLVDVCCDSSMIKLERLNDKDGARSDAWAACVFSKYQWKRPLDCMLKVCQQGEEPDLIGEYQTCKQLLALPAAEFGSDEADAKKEAIEQRLNEIDKELSESLQR